MSLPHSITHRSQHIAMGMLFLLCAPLCGMENTISLGSLMNNYAEDAELNTKVAWVGEVIKHGGTSLKSLSSEKRSTLFLNLCDSHLSLLTEIAHLVDQKRALMYSFLKYGVPGGIMCGVLSATVIFQKSSFWKNVHGSIALAAMGCCAYYFKKITDSANSIEKQLAPLDAINQQLTNWKEAYKAVCFPHRYTIIYE